MKKDNCPYCNKLIEIGVTEHGIPYYGRHISLNGGSMCPSSFAVVPVPTLADCTAKLDELLKILEEG
jgi:hypothetical protein